MKHLYNIWDPDFTLHCEFRETNTLECIPTAAKDVICTTLFLIRKVTGLWEM